MVCGSWHSPCGSAQPHIKTVSLTLGSHVPVDNVTLVEDLDGIDVLWILLLAAQEDLPGKHNTTDNVLGPVHSGFSIKVLVHFNQRAG